MFSSEELKKKVATTPLVAGGSNFKTHNLIKTNDGFVFKSSVGAKAFASVFAVIGCIVLCFGVYKLLTVKFEYFFIFFLVFGGIFLTAGLFLLFKLFQPKVFSKRLNYYYQGFSFKGKDDTKNATKLNRVIALQLIGETIYSENQSYKSFELNLVLNDASRINVVDHGNLKQLTIDSEALSNAFDLPIWHAETGK